MSAKPKQGLGRGLDSLIPTNFDADLLLDKHERIQNLFISDIKPNPAQPRKHFDQAALKELAASIKRHGVLQPLIVTPATKGTYTLVAGERRWRAAGLAKLDKVPAIVRERAELDQLEIALVENVQRIDLSSLEQAVSIERLHQQFNLSYQDIAKRLGKAETTVSNIVRLLGLPKAAQEALAEGIISEGHARAILALKQDPKKQAELLQLIIQNKWSVRQAEQFVSSLKQGDDSSRAARRSSYTETSETKRLGKQLNTSVKLRRTAKGGVVEIAFRDETQLKNLIDRLGNQ